MLYSTRRQHVYGVCGVEGLGFGLWGLGTLIPRRLGVTAFVGGRW